MKFKDKIKYRYLQRTYGRKGKKNNLGRMLDEIDAYLQIRLEGTRKK